MTPQTAMLHDPFFNDDDGANNNSAPPQEPIGTGDPMAALLANDREVGAAPRTAAATSVAPDPMSSLMANDGISGAVVDPYAAKNATTGVASEEATYGAPDPMSSLMANDGISSGAVVDPYTTKNTTTGVASEEATFGARDPMSSLMANDGITSGAVVDPYTAKNTTTGVASEENHGGIMLDLIRSDRYVDAEAAASRGNAPSGPGSLEPAPALAQSSEPPAQPVAMEAAVPVYAYSFLTGALADLYSVDQEFSRAKSSRADHDNISALAELLEVDRAADRALRRRRNETEGLKGTFADLLATDRAVDASKAGRRASDGDAGDFVDPFSNSALRQADLESTRALTDEQGLSDVADLLRTDVEMDGARRRQIEEMIGLLPMLRVDRQFARTATRETREHDVGELADLLAVDREVDRARMSTHKKKGDDVAFAATSKSATSAAVVGSGLTGTLAELYAVDLQFSGAAVAHRRKDELSAIVELLEVDREMDRALKLRRNEGSTVRRAMEALLAVDRSIDGAKSKSAEPSAGGAFFDPFTKSAVGHFLASEEAARAESEERALFYVASLLEVDREIDGHRAYNDAVESLGPMYRVDLFVDGNRGRAARGRGVDALADLLVVDREMDAAKKRRDGLEGMTVGGGGSSGEDPMAALLAVDRLIDGRTGRDEEKEFLRGVEELAEVDRTVETLSLPSAGSLEEGVGGGVNIPDPPAAPQVPALVTNAPAQEGASGLEGGKGGRSIFSSAEKESAKAMADVQDLLKVDRSVDRNKRPKSRGAELEDVADLLAVDREVDRAKEEKAKREMFRANKAAIEEAEKQATQPQAQAVAAKRSIFSTKEKTTTSRRNSGPPPPPTVVLGSTMVVRGDAKMIGSIPVGENAATKQAKEEFFGKEREMVKPKQGASGDGTTTAKAKQAGKTKSKKGKRKDGCVVM